MHNLNMATNKAITIYSGPSHQTALNYLKSSIAGGRYIRIQMRQRGATWMVWAESIRPSLQGVAA